jgi:hypothetical protein
MITVTIDGVVPESMSGERLIDIINRVGINIFSGLLSP